MIRLLHLSDPHFGAVDPAAASAFLSQARQTPPDFTVLSGDLTMRARRRELAQARDFVDSLPAPRLVIPGNHDIPALNQPFHRFISPFRRYRQTFGPDLEPEHLDSNLHILSLNSNRPFGLHADWSEGFLSRGQLRRMVARFRSSPPGLFRILVLHHPLLAPLDRLRKVVHPLPGLLAAIDRARVDLVLCGHFHRSRLATAGTLGGWTCVVSQAPTVCSTRLQGEPQGFHHIHISPGHLEIIPRTFEKGSFLPGPPSRFIRRHHGWEDTTFRHSNELLATPES